MQRDATEPWSLEMTKCEGSRKELKKRPWSASLGSDSTALWLFWLKQAMIIPNDCHIKKKKKNSWRIKMIEFQDFHSG